MSFIVTCLSFVLNLKAQTITSVEGSTYLLKVSRLRYHRVIISLSGDPKNACLKQLDKAQENLHLFMADVLDYDALTAAFARCEGVFHVASPVPIDKMVDKEASTPYDDCLQRATQKIIRTMFGMSSLSVRLWLYQC